MRVNVRNMQRVPHRHNFQTEKINGRLACSSCPYRVPRKDSKTVTALPVTKTRDFNSLKATDLLALARKSGLKVTSKTRKAELVELLTAA